MADSSASQLCQICNITVSLYTCPRCRLPYCSKKCYTSPSHSNCSEEFYKEQIHQQLKNHNAPPESRKQMLEMLERLEKEETEEGEEEEIDSDDEEDLSERLKGIDLDDSDAVWERMTEEERKNFQQLVESGDLTSILPAYEPWWIESPVESCAKIVEIDEETAEALKDTMKGSVSCSTRGEGSSQGKAKASKKSSSLVRVYDSVPMSVREKYPNLPTPSKINLLKDLTSSVPSPSVRFSVVNVVAAYVWTIRIYNGDVEDNVLEACESMQCLSVSLSCQGMVSSMEESLASINVRALQHQWLGFDEALASSVSEDTLTILTGVDCLKGYFTHLALSHSLQIFEMAKKKLKEEESSGDERNSIFLSSLQCARQTVPMKLTTITGCNNAIRKLKFLLAYNYENKEI